MKKYLLLLTLTALSTFALANKVDNLQTDQQVASFLNSFLKKKAVPFTVQPTDYIWRNAAVARQAEIKNWQKADLNGDGRTDLLVNAFLGGFRPFVLISTGKRSFRMEEIGFSMFDRDDVAKIIEVDNQPLIVFYPQMFGEDHAPMHADTLTYRFDALVNYNAHPIHREVAEYTFSTGMCFGQCPVFAITVKANGDATYTGGKFNEDEGEFVGRVLSKDMHPFLELIDYLDLNNLKNDYKVDWTDDATCWLTIKFKDGTQKQIQDYGERGTFSLRRLYAMFFSFKKDQVWYEKLKQ